MEVDVMGWQCVPQLTGLVRGDPKPGQKHRGNGEKIAKEMGHERYSKSNTLDRSRSHLNSYDGYDGRGGDAWDAMCEDAASYKVKVHTKKGDFERALKSDAVLGCAVLVSPPLAMIEGWTAEECDMFFDDAQDCLHEIEPRIFRPVNRRFTARHRDEGYVDIYGEHGEHEHRIYDCIDANGKYCGNLVDFKLLDAVNRRFPAMMRERGWDIDDCDITDRSRMGWFKDSDGNYVLDDAGERIPVDPAYRAERLEKQNRQGLSANQYAAELKARASQEAAQLYDQARQTERDARRERHAIRAEANEYAQATRDDADEYARTTRRQADQDAEKIKQDAQDEADRITQQAQTDAEKRAAEIQSQLRERLQREVDEARDERDKAVNARDAAVAALRGDYETWAGLTSRPTAAGLLGVLGAAVAVSREKAEAARSTPPSEVAGAYARMMAMMERTSKTPRNAVPGPHSVEGPTM